MRFRDFRRFYSWCFGNLEALMAGHSKWANIKHRKGSQDAKKSKVFTKIIKEITVAVKLDGNDIESNPRLRKNSEECFRG